LNWQLVSKVRSSTPQPQQETAEKPTVLPSDNDFEALVQRLQEHCRQKILSQHSRMRLLSGEEIGVDQLYVDVWLLNRSPRTFQVSQSKLLETFDLRNDRLGLGDRIQRNPGFEIANENPKLVILGKPGAGKTTFLKHLAVDWCKGQFQPVLVAVLIEFRRIRGEQWHLIDAISEELGLSDGPQIRALSKEIKALNKEILIFAEDQKRKEKLQVLQQQLNTLPLQVLLTKGKFLVLMDGLDEVPTNDLRSEVQRQLCAITEEYSRNRFVLTSRTQILTSIPNGFTSVEVSDFSPEQVKQFVQNWFMANSKSKTIAIQKWENLKNAIDNKPALKEMTVTPVLLSLICLVLQDAGEITSQVDWLYQKGIRLLLSRWNDDKQIDGWEVGIEAYRQLNIEQKEELLLKIAARKFENPKNFVLFEENEIVAQITQSLKLPNRTEAVAVLKAIEAQHGLLIERADELWSFSHLTFQEHFTVQWLMNLSPEELAEKVTNHQWQEVVKKLVNSQQPADRLLRLIKQAIDRSIANEPVANQFLTWVFQKAQSIQARYKLSAIRAFYFARALDRAIDQDLALVLALTRDRDRTLDRTLDRALDLDINLDIIPAQDLDLDLELDRALDRARFHNLDYARALNHAQTLDHARALNLDLTLVQNLARHISCEYTPKLVNQIEELRLSLPKDLKESSQWDRAEWVKQLQQAIIEHRNIGHDWQFTNAQKKQFQRYYDANNFLATLMNVEGAINDTARLEIEETLLLPWDELQRRQPDVYGQRQVE